MPAKTTLKLEKCAVEMDQLTMRIRCDMLISQLQQTSLWIRHLLIGLAVGSV